LDGAGGLLQVLPGIPVNTASRPKRQDNSAVWTTFQHPFQTALFLFLPAADLMALISLTKRKRTFSRGSVSRSSVIGEGFRAMNGPRLLAASRRIGEGADLILHENIP